MIRFFIYDLIHHQIQSRVPHAHAGGVLAAPMREGLIGGA